MVDHTKDDVAAYLVETNYAGGKAGAKYAMTASNSAADFTASNYPMGEQKWPYREFERDAIRYVGGNADAFQTFIKGYKYADANSKFYAQNYTWLDAAISALTGGLPTSYYWKFIRPKGQIDAFGCVVKKYTFTTKSNDWPSESIDWHYYDCQYPYQELGLVGKALTDDTALAHSTTYTYQINGVAFAITTVTDHTYGTVLDLINAQSGYLAYAEIVGGDVRFTRCGLGPIILGSDTTGNDLVSTLTANTAPEIASTDAYSATNLSSKAYNTATPLLTQDYKYKVNNVEYTVAATASMTYLALMRVINAQSGAVAIFHISAGVPKFSSISRTTASTVTVTEGSSVGLLAGLVATMTSTNDYITKAFSTASPTIHKDCSISIGGTTYSEVSDLDVSIENEYEDTFVVGRFQHLDPNLKSRKTTIKVTFYATTPDIISELGGKGIVLKSVVTDLGYKTLTSTYMRVSETNVATLPDFGIYKYEVTLENGGATALSTA